MSSIKIPLWIAIIINANIVIGSAFFLSAGKLIEINGVLAPLAWLICGLILLPFIMVLAGLTKQFPQAGGLYIYSEKCLGSLWGFISGWGYYIGVIAANAAVIHAFSSELQKNQVLEHGLRTFWLHGISFDAFLVLIFTILNLCNIEFLERVQIAFAVLKSIPFLLVIMSLPFLFNNQNLFTASPNWSSLLSTIPWAFFAFIGVEACCSIVDKIENGKQNASRVLFASFFIIIAVYTVLQFALLCIDTPTSQNPFLSLLPKLTNNQHIIAWGNTLIYGAILSSFLGGFYGMFYFNNWNLYAIAKEKSILFSDYLIIQNKEQVPWVCVLIQSSLVMFFLIFSNSSDYLVTMSDFGTVITYFLSVISFLTLFPLLIGFFALTSCLILMYICGNNLITTGLFNIFPFVLVLLAGVVAHKINDVVKKQC